MQRIKFPTTFALVMAVAGCGIVVGNPDDPDVNEDKSFIPTINFAIPTAVSGLALTSGDDPLSKWANRSARVIDSINRMLVRLNNDNIKEVGQFTGKGVDGLVSGTISDIQGEVYRYAATLCYNNTPFQYFQWSESGDKIYAIKDHSIDPDNKLGTKGYITEVVYNNGDPTTLTIAANGDPWFVPSGVVDGTSLLEKVTATRFGDTFTFKGVNNWYAQDADSANDVDGYLVGTFNNEGVGEFVAWEDFMTPCQPDFSEGTPEGSWCLGRTIGQNRYGDAERLAAWERLKNIGILNKANLQDIALPGTLACP